MLSAGLNMAFHQSSVRSGRYIKHQGGFPAFIPAPLPPDPRLSFDDSFLDLLSMANHAVGRLDGCTETLLNPDLFVFMYIRKEAVLSSQIEGAQASLMDVLAYEAAVRESIAGDVGDVFNYVAAMDHGLKRLKKLPLSLRLIKEIHGRLLSGLRGSWEAGEIQDKPELDRSGWMSSKGRPLYSPTAARDGNRSREPRKLCTRQKSATISAAGWDRSCSVRDHSSVRGRQRSPRQVVNHLYAL
jgi:hypothetical protein